MRGNDGQAKRVSGIRHIQVEVVLAGNGTSATAVIPTPTPVPTISHLEIGKEYLAPDGIMVAVDKIEVREIKDTAASVTFKYRLINPTSETKEHQGFNLYWEEGLTGMTQVGFFGLGEPPQWLNPGQTVNREYTFGSVLDNPFHLTPSTIAYPSRYWSRNYKEGDLIWNIK